MSKENMSAADEILRAVEQGDYEELSVKLEQWEKPGSILIGKLIEIDTYQGDEYETECGRYMFLTLDGRVSTIFGQVGDRVMNKPELIGKWFHITFLGKQEGKKRRWNDFSFKLIKPGKVK